MIPKVSVIVPVYNVEQYLEQCLDSIINQSLKGVEIIVIDDGSTDNSKNIILKYAKKYSNIIVIYQSNKGLSVARNNALKKASGKYIFYVDSDDFLELNCLEKLYKKAENTEADIVIYAHKEIYSNGKQVAINLDVNQFKEYSGKQVANMVLRCDFLGVVWNKLFKRENLIRNQLYFEENRYVQDWYPVFIEIFKSSKICFLNEALYNYRIRNESITSKKTKKNIDDYYYAANNIVKYARRNNLSYDDILIFKINAFNNIINRYYNLYFNDKDEFYNGFKLTDYYNMQVSSLDAIRASGINYRIKLDIISWNINKYHLIMKFKQYIREKRLQN